MEKNTAGKWIVFAFDRTDNTPVTGDAANITANVRIDGGAANAVDDTNPTELEDGYYVFDVTAAEMNGDMILLTAQSTTADVQVIAVPGVIHTVPANFNDLVITGGAVNSAVQSIASAAITAASIASNAITDAKIAAGAFTAAKFAADAITAAKLATDAVTEIATGVWAAATRTLTAATNFNNLSQADIRTAVGLASANLDTQLATIDSNVDAILVDTNELQTNQGNWVTATGFATAASLSTVEGKIDTIDTVVDGIQSDLDNPTDGLGAIQSAVGGLNDFDPATEGVNVTQINGSTEAAEDLAASAETIVRGVVAAGTLTTTAMTTNLTETTDDHYNGRLVIWTSGVLKDQATNITDYDGTTKELTFTAVTEAPTAGDTFVIV